MGRRGRPSKAVSVFGSNGIRLTNNVVLASVRTPSFRPSVRTPSTGKWGGPVGLDSSFDGFEVMEETSSVWGWVVSPCAAPNYHSLDDLAGPLSLVLSRGAPTRACGAALFRPKTSACALNRVRLSCARHPLDVCGTHCIHTLHAHTALHAHTLHTGGLRDAPRRAVQHHGQ